MKTALKRVLSTCVISAALLTSGQAARADLLKEVNAELLSAAGRCDAVKDWQSTVAHMECYDGVEEAVFAARVPAALPYFQAFRERRLQLARAYDAEHARAHASWLLFHGKISAAEAELRAREPRWATGQTSQLEKDLEATNNVADCRQVQLTPRLSCAGAIIRPIWQQDAPKTIQAFDKMQAIRIALASKFDAAGSERKLANAADIFHLGVKAAAIRLQVELSELVPGEQPAVARPAAPASTDRDDDGGFLGALLQGVAGGVAVAAQARADADNAGASAIHPLPPPSQPMPSRSGPVCSPYCQMMIQTGHVRANDTCAVQCAN